MIRKLRLLTLMLALIGCAGCSINPFRPPTTERQTQWARMGTPGYVVSPTPEKPVIVPLLVPEGEKLVPSRGRIDGMVVIDQPTFEYYRKLDAEKQARPAP
ncbi:MAG: hypothetical protein M5U26_03540 [Planctomycetota bacterium]|nr:hypothetical protein [Planctomycetota bacterium]